MSFFQMELLNVYAMWMNLMLYVSKRPWSLALRGKMFKITADTLPQSKCRAQIGGVGKDKMRSWWEHIWSARLTQSVILSFDDATRERLGWCSMISDFKFRLLSFRYLSFSQFKLLSFWNCLEFFSLFNFLDLYFYFISQPDDEFSLKYSSSSSALCLPRSYFPSLLRALTLSSALTPQGVLTSVTFPYSLHLCRLTRMLTFLFFPRLSCGQLDHFFLFAWIFLSF